MVHTEYKWELIIYKIILQLSSILVYFNNCGLNCANELAFPYRKEADDKNVQYEKNRAFFHYYYLLLLVSKKKNVESLSGWKTL